MRLTGSSIFNRLPMMQSLFVVVPALALAAMLSCNSASSHPGENNLAVEDSAGFVFPAVHYSWMAGNQRDTVSNLYRRIDEPEGFYRLKVEPGSFGEWLRFLPVHPEGKKVLLHNGELKNRQDVHAAVVNIDPGTSDLQQCADAVMRLRAEYLFSTAQYSRIHFNYTSGDNCDYTDWTKGGRIKVAGNKTSHVVTDQRSEKSDHGAFRTYMNSVFMYAGTLSLTREMISVPVDSMRIGDVFIYGGSPGHAVLVVDMCVNEKGEKLFMIAQSYMPAQEIHVLKNPGDSDLSPWYPVKFGKVLETPEWEFESSELKRFAE